MSSMLAPVVHGWSNPKDRRGSASFVASPQGSWLDAFLYVSGGIVGALILGTTLVTFHWLLVTLGITSDVISVIAGMLAAFCLWSAISTGRAHRFVRNAAPHRRATVPRWWLYTMSRNRFMTLYGVFMGSAVSTHVETALVFGLLLVVLGGSDPRVALAAVVAYGIVRTLAALFLAYHVGGKAERIPMEVRAGRLAGQGARVASVLLAWTLVLQLINVL